MSIKFIPALPPWVLHGGTFGMEVSTALLRRQQDLDRYVLLAK